MPEAKTWFMKRQQQKFDSAVADERNAVMELADAAFGNERLFEDYFVMLLFGGEYSLARAFEQRGMVYRVFGDEAKTKLLSVVMGDAPVYLVRKDGK